MTVNETSKYKDLRCFKKRVGFYCRFRTLTKKTPVYELKSLSFAKNLKPKQDEKTTHITYCRITKLK